ncbi:MAG: glycine cleavage system aminomethyltransferase GcvT [Solitalea-like symbiont of Acarus siro]
MEKHHSIDNHLKLTLVNLLFNNIKNMKETPLINIHKELNANLVDFAGYTMPVYYSSALKEHKRVRESLGIFDVSHMGQIIIYGQDAMKFIQRITTNNVTKLLVGKAQYTLLLNEEGGVIDDLIIYKLKEDKFMLVVNAANIEKDYNWILRCKATENIHIENISDRMALIALQGPMALQALENITSKDLATTPYYSFIESYIADVKNIIISVTGYTGAGGFELYVNNADAEKLWKTIMEAGEKYNILPAGLAARDSLRLEKGYCLYGHEITEKINPLEAKLSWVVDFAKDFIGKEALLKIKGTGIEKTLVGITAMGRSIPRQGDIIISEKGDTIGVITSGGFSPILERPIAMGYINKNSLDKHTKILIKSRNKEMQAVLTKIPFV